MNTLRFVRSSAWALALQIASATVAHAADTTPAQAAPADADQARAKALFDAALEQARAGDFPAACQKLEQSLALHQGLGISFHLAGCWLKLGRTASSYALFEQVADKAHELGQTDRERLARERMAAIVPKLSRLRIDVKATAPGLEVSIDGRAVPEVDWGKPFAVDRGPHEVRATAEGKEPLSIQVDVTEPATTIALVLPPLADAPKRVPPSKPLVVTPAPAKPARRAPRPAAPPEPAADGSSRRALALVIGGVGVAALGAGVLEGAQYLDSNREAKGLCPSSRNCTSDEIRRHGEAVDDARTARTWAYVGVGVGSAALVTAAYLYLTAPAGRPSSTALTLEPLIDGRGSWGGSVLGSF